MTVVVFTHIMKKKKLKLMRMFEERFKQPLENKMNYYCQETKTMVFWPCLKVF